MAETISDHEPNRRDFLYVSTAVVGAVTTGAAVWPLIDSMNPDASVLALASIEVDISAIEPGTQVTVKWRGKPVFIRRRTEKEIAEGRAVKMEDLVDTVARNANLPSDALATDQDRTLDKAGEWLIMVGICTHLGCIPLGHAGDYGGWFCPCHGSQYDIAGRIRKGPAPRNLDVPLTTRINDSTIKLG